jgi:hypothetical protein
VVDFALDHLFVCSAPKAPAAALLREFGLTEGSPNRHTGQGTACRRFFFRNAMLELLWVEDADEAQLPRNKALGLWERFSTPASPFGIIIRPAAQPAPDPPFPAWKYSPESMPDLFLYIAEGVPLAEPMWCYTPFGRQPAEAPPERRQPLDHPAGLRDVTRVTLHCPPLPGNSITRAMAEHGIISLREAPEHLIELNFDGGCGDELIDFCPSLPLIFRRQVRRGTGPVS